MSLALKERTLSSFLLQNQSILILGELSQSILGSLPPRTNITTCRNISQEKIYGIQDGFDIVFCANMTLEVLVRAKNMIKDSGKVIFLKTKKEKLISFFDVCNLEALTSRFISARPREEKISGSTSVEKSELLIEEMKKMSIEESESLLNISEPTEKEVSKPLIETVETLKSPRNTILWVMNVCWQGGTALYVLDAIRSMRSSWNHKVIYLNQREDTNTYQRFQELGIDISYCPQITKKLIKEIDPVCVMLSNTNPKSIEGGYPWKWLTKETMTIYIHHSAVTPWLEGVETEIFVSNYLKNQYNNLKDRLSRPIVLPPGIHTRDYAVIERHPKSNSSPTVIGYLASDNPSKFPKEILDIVDAASSKSKNKNIVFRIVGGDKHIKTPPENLNYTLELAPFTSNIKHEYSKFDIFLYKSKVMDTWGRTVSEAMASGLPVITYHGGAMPEQIEHKRNGFLCKNDKDYIESLITCIDDPIKRFTIGSLARMKAFKDFDISRFAEYVEPMIMTRSWYL